MEKMLGQAPAYTTDAAGSPSSTKEYVDVRSAYGWPSGANIGEQSANIRVRSANKRRISAYIGVQMANKRRIFVNIREQKASNRAEKGGFVSFVASFHFIAWGRERVCVTRNERAGAVGVGIAPIIA